METFPTVQDLAASSLEQVRLQWQGLGTPRPSAALGGSVAGGSTLAPRWS